MNRIDNHFSEKLKDLEIKPSERANRLFMEQIAPQKKPIWKYFTMAASILLALGILLGLYINSGVLTPETASSLPKTQEEPAAQTHQEENSSPFTSIKEEIIERRVEETKIAKHFAYQGSPVSMQKALEKEESSTAKFTYEEIEESSPMRVSNLKRASGFKYYDTELTDFSILDVHSSEIEIEKPSFQPISAPAEKSLLVKVAEEIKYIVHGEQPDLDRSGIKPVATVIAHNQSGFIANETRQIKQGLNKVKEIFK